MTAPGHKVLGTTSIVTNRPAAGDGARLDVVLGVAHLCVSRAHRALRYPLRRRATNPDMTTSESETTPNLRRAERRDRNRAIAEAREGGATWPVVAERFALSERHARRAYLEYVREAGRLIDLDPAETLREVVQVHTWALEELRALAATADNSSARVGAVRSRVTVAQDLLKLLVTAGVVPSADQIARLDLEREKRQFAAAVIDALECQGIDFGSLDEDLDRALLGQGAADETPGGDSNRASEDSGVRVASA